MKSNLFAISSVHNITIHKLTITTDYTISGSGNVVIMADTDEERTTDDFKCWKVDALKAFIRERTWRQWN